MNALTKSPTGGMVLRPQSFGELVQFAQMAAKSNMVPPTYKGQPESIMLAIQMGSELGLAPMQSLQNIAVVNGRPTVWGDAVVGLCRQSSVCKDIVENVSGEGDKMVATCTAVRIGAEPIVRSFSVEDAKKAGLWGKSGPWQQYPKRMLQMRARGFAVRDAFPDVLRGLITAEEAADMPADNFAGTTIEARPVPAITKMMDNYDRGIAAIRPDPEQVMQPMEPPKAKRTWGDFLDELDLELANVTTAEEVDEILARASVQTAQDQLQNGAKDRLQSMIDAAIKRTAAAETTAPNEDEVPA